MKVRILLRIIPVVLVIASASFAQPKGEHKLVQFQMAIFTKGPKWETTSAEERGRIFKQHLANVLSMYESGNMAMAGPFGDDTNLIGIFVMRTTSAAEAKAWIDADPAVKAGLMVPEMHSWWSEDHFKKPNTPLKLEKVYFGFLRRGPNRKEGDASTPEVQALQKTHIANIERLAGLKKLVVAGLFGDDGDLRGIFVFRVASMQEAHELAATDPMIKIDRLRIELHPWNVPAGVLP